MPNRPILETLLATCPGLVGDIARYIDAKSNVSQPGIALGSALAMVSALKSGRIRSQFTIAPCLFTAIIAPSGVGKSRAQDVVMDLIYRAGASNIVLGKPASDSGLLSALEQKKKLLIWDEFGPAISALSNSKASYEALLLSTMMDIYSRTGRSYVGKEYSKASNRERVDIKEIYLSIFAASTPSRFFGALTSDFVLDGFLPRWLIFFGNEKLTFKKESEDEDSQSLVERIKKLSTPPKTIDYFTGNIRRAIGYEKEWVDFDDEAGYLHYWRYECQKHQTDASNEIERIFWSRAFENSIKILLCLEENGVVTSSDLRYAFELVEFLTATTISQCSNCIYESKQQKLNSDLLDKFHNCIAIGESITKSHLTGKTQRWCRSFERNQVIESLVESETWSTFIHQNKTYFKRLR